MPSQRPYPSISEQLHHWLRLHWLGLLQGPKSKRVELQAQRDLDFIRSIWNALVFQRSGWLPGAWIQD